jgi:hypothetical protein
LPLELTLSIFQPHRVSLPENRADIADLLSSCLPVGKYLMAGKPLTKVQLDSISMTILGLERNFMIWKSKVGEIDASHSYFCRRK